MEQTLMPKAPEVHFPGAYTRPCSPLHIARRVAMSDGAQIAAFVYVPKGKTLEELIKARKTPVLFLHGNQEEHGIFGPVIDAVVSAGYPAIALDSRAQGKSTRGSKPLTYELMTDDAVQVLCSLGVTRVHVAGFSDGGIEALLLARDYPTYVVSLLAIGANLTPEGVIDEDWDIEGNANTHLTWHSYWTQKSKQDTKDSHIDVSLLFCDPGEAKITAELLQLMVDEPHIDPESLRVIDCPACIMAGEHDCILPQETMAINDAIPGSRLVVVPKMGHSLPKHAPADVSRELLINMLLSD